MDDLLTSLVGLFNAGKIDLPDAALDKDCVFRLNGRAYHEHLGRPAGDPLVRLIGRGPAGYRFVLAALRYALGHPRLDLHDQHRSERHDSETHEITRRASLSGVLRGSGQPFSAECELTVHGGPGGPIREIAVTMGDPDIELLMDARRR